MLNFIRKRVCKHDFKFITSYEGDLDNGVGYRMGQINIVYCAKCRTELRLPNHEFDLLMAKQELHKKKK